MMSLLESIKDGVLSPKRILRAFLGQRAMLLTGLALAAICLVAAMGGEITGAKTASRGVPITFHLEAPSYVTLVIEDDRGNRVRNLLAETLLPAGDQTVSWDGYDDGNRGTRGELTRHRVPPGTYHLRGLTHDGIRMSYEMTVYNPGKPPWSTKDKSGGFLADHSRRRTCSTFLKGSKHPMARGKLAFSFAAPPGRRGTSLPGSTPKGSAFMAPMTASGAAPTWLATWGLIPRRLLRLCVRVWPARP